MNGLYKEMNSHLQQLKDSTASGDAYNLQRGIETEIKRIAATAAIQFKKGDYFSYEEQDFSWLI